MKARVAASVIIAAGIVLGTAGCNLIAPQATTKHYDASDGVSGSVGDVDIRNAFLVADGASVNLVASFVDSSGDHTITVQPDADASQNQYVTIAGGGADAVTVVGSKKRVQFNGLNVTPGALVPVFFQYGSEEGVTLKLPVLTDAMAEYKSYGPTQTPKPITTSTAVPTP